MSIRFDNRVAIVTGAGNGLGRSHALLLAARGASVVVNDPGGARDGKGGDHAAADKVVAEIKAAGGKAVANYDSVAERDSAANIVKTAVDAFGTVDIVVNNAGILRDKSFHNMSLDDFEFVLKVHLLGSAYVSHAAFPIMRTKSYGRIVMTSSNSGVYGNFGQTNYAASKFGVIGFTKTWSRELGPKGVRVNAVAPGFVETPILATIPPKVLQQMREHVPLKRLGRPEEIANVYAFLASDEASYINGAVIEVSGGMMV